MSDEIIKEAQERFKRCQEWTSLARNNFLDDMRFIEADAYNGFQWEPETMRQRQLKRKPSLTINKARQYCLQVINDFRQNKSQIRIVPVSDDASKKSAEVFEGLVRHIEYISNAQGAYIHAVDSQVKGGIGYWRVVTDYKSDRSLDQEIYIRKVKDPMSVYMDPDMREQDGSDARFAFIFEDLPKELAKKKYPRYVDQVNTAALGNHEDMQTRKEIVRIAEYYRRSEKSKTLVVTDEGQSFIVGSGQGEIAQEIADGLIERGARKREIVTQNVEWFLIIGDKIAKKTQWAGKYIPIVRVVGSESVIDGIYDCKGHARALIDPQRMYNYWASASTEQIALQTKTPWIAPVEAIEGFEEIWKNSAITEPTVLPFRTKDTTGQAIPQMPQRVEPPTLAQAYMMGLQISEQQMQIVSGQYEASMGEPSNEKSGKAINARQRQGENATYHFIDNFSQAIRFTGEILIDLIPKIYDTERVIQILAENGDRSLVQVSPQAPQAHQQMGPDEMASIVFNPAVGEYAVEADVGPAYQTRRQEAFQAFIDIAQASPEIMAKAGDLMFKAADFPLSDEIAERLKPGPDPAMMQAQQELQKQQGVIQKLMNELADRQAETGEATAKREIAAYEAITKRLDVLGKIDPSAIEATVRMAVSEALRTHIPNLRQQLGMPQEQQEELNGQDSAQAGG